jgi:GMP synthase (glutamine-hydrolysing) A subunit
MELWHDRILVLDFGSQYTQLIARRIREAHVYSQILPCTVPLATILAYRPKGIVLSGGPSSVYDKKAPSVAKELFAQGIPILGICYGMQLVTHLSGGEVAKASHREYGRAQLTIDDRSDLFKGIGDGGSTVVWMSHGDRIERMPPGFRSIAHTENSRSPPCGGMTGKAGSIVSSFIPRLRTHRKARRCCKTSCTTSADVSRRGPCGRMSRQPWSKSVSRSGRIRSSVH